MIRALAALLAVLAALLGPQLLLTLAITVAGVITIALAWGISQVVTETGWGVVPRVLVR